MSEQKLIDFEIVTLERELLNEKVQQITVPTESGEITILPNHIPLVTIVKPGVIELIKENNEPEILSISGGFLEILKDKVVIMADTAELASELDEERIALAKARAQELKDKARYQDRIDFTEAAIALEKELARGRAKERWKKIKNLK